MTSHPLPTPASLSVRLTAVSTLGPVDLARWRDLAEHAVEPNVFYGPDFLAPTAAHFDPARALRLVVVESGGAWLAVMPYEMVPANRRWPHRHASNDGPILNQFTSLGVPLLRGDDPQRAATGLVRALRRFSHELGGSIEMAFVSGDGPGGAALQRAFTDEGSTLHRWGGDERAAVRFAEVDAPGGFGYLPRSRAKAVRRRARRLTEAVGVPAELDTLTLDAVADPAEFLRFELDTWKADPDRDGPGFSRLREGPEWFTDVFQAHAATGDAILLALRPAGETLYMAAFLRSGGTVFAWYDEYAEKHAQHAPGVLGRLLTVKRFAAQGGLDLLDSCMHPSLYPDQNELYPSRLRTVSFTAALGRWPGQLLLREIVALGRKRRGLARRVRAARARRTGGAVGAPGVAERRAQRGRDLRPAAGSGSAAP
ncbi:GNAT family N-acetyltransferase [Oerskovia turbata]